MDSPCTPLTRRIVLAARASLGAMVVTACLLGASASQRPTPAVSQAPPISPIVAAPQTRESPRQISDYIREIFQDRDGAYWFGTNGDGVCRYDGTSLTYFSLEQGFGGVAVRGIVQDEAGAIWFATEGGVSRLASGVFTNFTVKDGLSDNSIWSIMLDSSGTIWVGTQEGVCRFDGTAFIPFPLPRVAVESPESRFTPKVVFAMFEEPSGALWFGTDGEGAHRFDGTAFTSYTTKEGLGGNLVRAIQGDRFGRIWIGVESGGVSRLDGGTFRTFTTKDGLTGDRVWEIREDRAGNMWFSTLGAGACRYDGTTFAPFGVEQGLSVNELPCPCGSGRAYKECHGPGGGHVQEIFEDKDGILWFGCSGGLFRLERERFINVTRSGPWPAPPKASVPANGKHPSSPES